MLALCLLAAACASTDAPSRWAQTHPAQLVAGASIAAPDGVIEYCARNAGECGGALRTDLRGRIAATGAPRFQTASWSDQDEAQGSVFHAMMAQRLAQGARTTVPSRASMVLTPVRWRELRAVNREINRAIAPVEDLLAHGVAEHWDRPLSSGAVAQGDCEDFALEKRARLIALGWSPEMLAIAVAVAPGAGLHATLVVQTDHGDFVLDNLDDEPQPLARLDYVWISRQAGPDLTRWAAARMTGAPLLQREQADASAEAMFARLMREHAGVQPEAEAQPTTALASAAAPSPMATPTPSSAEIVRPAPKPSPQRPRKPTELALASVSMRIASYHIEP